MRNLKFAKLATGLLFSLGLCRGSACFAQLYTLGSGDIYAQEDIGGNVTLDDASTSSGSASATTPGSNGFASTGFTASTDGLSLDTSDSRDGTLGDYSESQWGIYFTPTENLTYTITGTYNASASPVTFNTFLSQGGNELYQGNITTAFGSQNLNLGTNVPIIEGSLTGTLMASVQYDFSGTSEIMSNGDSGATAAGNIGISFAPVNISDNYWWIAGTSNWNSNTNWSTVSPTGAAAASAPVSNSNTYIVDSDGISRTVTYDYPGPAITLNWLTVCLSGGTGGATNTLNMPSGNLTANYEFIGSPLSGYSGNGTFTQGGGTNTVNTGIYIGSGAPSSDTGTYNLQGGTLTGSGLLSIEPQGTMQGYGSINNLTIQNSGTINANNPNYGTSLYINVPSITNSGTIEATGSGNLEISNSEVVNSEGTILSAGGSLGSLANSSVIVSSSVISGGTINCSTTNGVFNEVFLEGTGTELDGYSQGPLTISGSSANGDGVYVESASPVMLAGTIINNGFIGSGFFSNYPTMNLKIGDANTNSATLSGTGSVAMNSEGDTISGYVYLELENGVVIGDTLTNGPNHTIEGQGTIQNLASLVNQGTINANQSGETLTIAVAYVTNSGTMGTTTSGSQLVFSGGNLVNTGTIDTSNGAGGMFTLMASLLATIREG